MTPSARTRPRKQVTRPISAAAAGVQPTEELDELLERLLTSIEDLVDVMSVPVDALAGEVSATDDERARNELPVSEPVTVTHPMRVAVPELVAHEGGPTPLSIPVFVACSFCDGSTSSGEGLAPCERCGGTGTLRATRQFEVEIPRGVTTGDLLRVSGDPGAGSALDSELLLQVFVVRAGTQTAQRRKRFPFARGR